MLCVYLEVQRTGRTLLLLAGLGTGEDDCTPDVGVTRTEDTAIPAVDSLIYECEPSAVQTTLFALPLAGTVLDEVPFHLELVKVLKANRAAYHSRTCE